MNDLIKNNIGLIRSQIIALKLVNNQDAESLGYEALYNAILTYDETKGYKLSTYASCCIYNALGCLIRNMNRKKQLDVISYNNIAYEDESGKHDFMDFLSDKTDASKELLCSELHSKVKEAYIEAYNDLPEGKQKCIVDTWHKSGYEIINKDIASEVGCSQPYVNQVLSMFKYKLKQKLEGYYYD